MFFGDKSATLRFWRVFWAVLDFRRLRHFIMIQLVHDLLANLLHIIWVLLGEVVG